MNIRTETQTAKGEIRSWRWRGRGRWVRRRRQRWGWLGHRSRNPGRVTNGGQTTRTMRQTVMKVILTIELFNLMSHVPKLMNPAQGSLLSQDRRPMTDHLKMMVMLGGLEVGLVVGAALMMGQLIRIMAKP